MSEQTVKQEGEFKIKRKTPKKLATPENNVTKVSMKEPLINTEPEVTKVVIKEDDAPAIEKPVAEVVEDNSPIQLIEEIEEDVKEEVKEVEAEYKEAIRDEKVIGKSLPENIEKLVSFMEETGGNINDYVRLNADYSNVDNETLLKEYYKQTKPYLEGEDISLMLEDFSYDEDIDEQRDIRKKKLAFKEEVAKARNFLEETKSKYYDEIKLRPGVTQDQQKATDFFNRYNKEQGEIQQKHEQFKRNTKDYFTKEFKGFEFEVGEKRFRYNVNNVNEVVENQSALSNFVKKFLNKDGNVKDLTGYHKALYSAQHADAIAKHFYDQGAADATKNVIAKSKNISNEARTTHSGDVFINGLKVKAINGVDSSKLKIKKRK